jgi:YHS domain-containing protein
MFVVFWGVMSAAGLITEGIFKATGLIPATRPVQVAPADFSWNYTTYLNIVFLVLFGLVYWVYRNRECLGGGGTSGLDPVCGMQVERANAAASLLHQGARLYFCSARCRERFETDPERFVDEGAVAPGG